jgi:hypothetical protein
MSIPSRANQGAHKSLCKFQAVSIVAGVLVLERDAPPGLPGLSIVSWIKFESDQLFHYFCTRLTSQLKQ